MHALNPLSEASIRLQKSHELLILVNGFPSSSVVTAPTSAISEKNHLIKYRFQINLLTGVLMVLNLDIWDIDLFVISASRVFNAPTPKSAT